MILAYIVAIIFQIFLPLTLVYLVFSYIISPRRFFGMVHSRWHHTFPEMQFSSKEFYASVSDAINKKSIDDISIDTVAHSQTGILSSNRAYLQIRRGDQMILICAAPFGTDFFVSWWLGEPLNFLKDLIPRIPVVGKHLAILLYSKTYYQHDTDTMFSDAIQDCVLSVIGGISNYKGYRGLTELERQPTRLAFNPRGIS